MDGSLLLLLATLSRDPARACAQAHSTPGVTMLYEDGWDPDLRTVFAKDPEGRPVRVAHVRCDEEPGASLTQVPMDGG